MYERLMKRPQDAILATVSLLVLSPVLLTIAGLIKWKIGGPVLFKQKRPGKDGVIFEMVKFRTMTDARDEHGELLPDEVRLTPFGQTLRSLSLDELPSLLNIVKGDIAIVGPRPLLVEYLPRYNEEQRRRHDVRPGLTGLAQVNGRNRLSWQDRFALDVQYVDNVTFFNDWKIILQTVLKVVKKDGISSDTAVTMEAFMGNEKVTNIVK
ncbi:sugar transferase [Exiguobacterium mexicanum]|uniref:Sugar transferase n=1 Tax=Exiguobacterium mexicanum TaxID=340146 RepID=A0ABT7MMJ4_9BACL|nr:MULTISPECIES: sugar transferase [Exiguobacterium]MDL5376411.1 sugar transferase [Exiguobacterium mexicanum]